MVQQSRPMVIQEASTPSGPVTGVDRVMVVGSGPHFMSGISHYTHALSEAFGMRYDTSVVLMRRLLPTRMYPGADRVGAPIADLDYPRDGSVYDGVDWFWFPSMFRALWLLWRRRPQVVTFQWWTGAVAHSYLLLAVVARCRGSRIILEMHEIQDTGEVKIPLVRRYTRSMMALLLRVVDGFVIHSEADLVPLATTYPIGAKPVEVVRHGPFRQYSSSPRPMRTAPPGCVNLTYFGTIRPYKGLEDLISAFETLENPERYWLTVIGETWEGWELPAERIGTSPLADRITFVNRYVTDAEAASWLAGADALVLPYRRSSASGPLHVGMSLGLPVAVTDIPSLTEAAHGYDGCVFFPPGDIDALRNALAAVASMQDMTFDDPASWDHSVQAYGSLMGRLDATAGRR
ncbi:glycosyltransferase [Gordonia sp. NPDC057258]|uniref:glycosyltransferase n=1 Tax=unclassified Gordonia (in: high G+C Gram-positive bacteria) TaxID=2657482 RepID=UPI003645E984